MRGVVTISNEILFLATSRVPSFSANSVNVMKISEALANEGYKLKLIALNNKAFEPKYDNILDIYEFYGVEPIFDLKLIDFKNKVLLYIYYLVYAKVNNPFLVYTRDALIAFLTCAFKVNTVLHVHGLIKKRSVKFIQKTIRSKHLKAIAVVSEGLLKVFKEEYLIDSQKIKVISNGVDINRFSPVLTKIEARINNGLPVDAKIICYSGHLHEGRGIDLIIKLADIMQNYVFVIVGGLPDDIKRWKKEASSNVLFIGHVPNREVSAYLFSADILLMPYQNISHTYGGNCYPGEIIRPLKLFEYMAAKRPIIASDLPGLREVLNKSNALLVKHDVLSEWENAVCRLFEEPLLADKIANKARKDVLEFTNNSVAREILNSVLKA